MEKRKEKERATVLSPPYEDLSNLQATPALHSVQTQGLLLAWDGRREGLGLRSFGFQG